MSTATENQPELDEKIWNAWIRKGKRQDKAIARNAWIADGAIFLLLAVGGAYYLLPS